MSPRNAPYISQYLSLVPAGAKQAADLHREEFQEVVREGHFPIMLPGMDSVQSSFTNAITLRSWWDFLEVHAMLFTEIS